jgi:hypothetical protein
MVFTGSVEIDLNCDMGQSLNELCPEAMPDQFQYARLTLYDAFPEPWGRQ